MFNQDWIPGSKCHTGTQAFIWSMSQPGHNPHCYNPVTYQCHHTGSDLVSYRWHYRLYPSNKSEEYPQILQPWWLSLKNFREIFRESFHETDSSEIFENSPELVPKMRDFCGITVLRLSLEKFLRNSLEFFPTKFLRTSPEYFSGNSWEILRTWSPCLLFFRGIK